MTKRSLVTIRPSEAPQASLPAAASDSQPSVPETAAQWKSGAARPRPRGRSLHITLWHQTERVCVIWELRLLARVCLSRVIYPPPLPAPTEAPGLTV